MLKISLLRENSFIWVSVAYLACLLRSLTSLWAQWGKMRRRPLPLNLHMKLASKHSSSRSDNLIYQVRKCSYQLVKQWQGWVNFQAPAKCILGRETFKRISNCGFCCVSLTCQILDRERERKMESTLVLQSFSNFKQCTKYTDRNMDPVCHCTSYMRIQDTLRCLK